MKRLWQMIIMAILCSPVFAADYYVTPTGSGDGSSWESALNWASFTPARGNVYLLDTGSYGAKTLSTAASSTETITIKNGGRGLVTFTDSLSISTGYWVIDGVTGGGPGGWKSGHGIVFTIPASTNVRGSFITLGEDVSNVTVSHVYFNQTGNPELYSDRYYSAIANETTVYDLLVEYCYFDNLGGMPFFFRGGSGVIIQHNYSGNICGASVADGNVHCEALVAWTLSDVHFRWNYIADSPSSGGYVKNAPGTSADVRIYGNVFNTGFPINCNTGTCSDWRIFNNTFHGTDGGPFGGDGTKTGILYYNNITSSADVGMLPGTHGYNWFSTIGSHTATSEGNETENINIRRPYDYDQYLDNTNPFVDSAGDEPEDFKLSFRLLAENVTWNNSWSTANGGWTGYDVCELDACTGEKTYNIDAFGTTRTNWDRGAYEYSTNGGDPSISAPSGLRVVGGWSWQ